MHMLHERHNEEAEGFCGPDVFWSKDGLEKMDLHLAPVPA